jgi:hypothetical protein
VLSLPVDAQCQDTVARGDFGKWMLKHIDRWFAFARGLGFGIDQMEELILVTGCDCTRSWANVAFLEGHSTQGQASFGVKVVQGRDVSINWRFSPENTEGAMVNWGPEGKVRWLANDFCDYETIFARLVHDRTYGRTNAYSFEGFVLFACSVYYRSSLKGQQE